MAVVNARPDCRGRWPLGRAGAEHSTGFSSGLPATPIIDDGSSVETMVQHIYSFRLLSTHPGLRAQRLHRLAGRIVDNVALAAGLHSSLAGAGVCSSCFPYQKNSRTWSAAAVYRLLCTAPMHDLSILFHVLLVFFCSTIQSLYSLERRGHDDHKITSVRGTKQKEGENILMKVKMAATDRIMSEERQKQFGICNQRKKTRHSDDLATESYYYGPTAKKKKGGFEIL